MAWRSKESVAEIRSGEQIHGVSVQWYTGNHWEITVNRVLLDTIWCFFYPVRVARKSWFISSDYRACLCSYSFFVEGNSAFFLCRSKAKVSWKIWITFWMLEMFLTSSLRTNWTRSLQPWNQWYLTWGCNQPKPIYTLLSLNEWGPTLIQLYVWGRCTWLVWFILNVVCLRLSYMPV